MSHHSHHPLGNFIFILIVVVVGMAFWSVIKGASKAPRKPANSRPEPPKRVPLVSPAWAEAGIEVIDTMSGVEFENYIAGLVRSVGRKVTMTPATGDFGVDLVVDDLFAIQCKRQSKPVGTAAVQQVIAGARMHKCCEMTFVVSNQTFTPAAVRLASVSCCGLYGRNNLEDFVEVMRAVGRSRENQEDENRPTIQRAMKKTSVRPPSASIKKATSAKKPVNAAKAISAAKTTASSRVASAQPKTAAPPTRSTPVEPMTKVRCAGCQHVQPAPVNRLLFACEECGMKLKRKTPKDQEPKELF